MNDRETRRYDMFGRVQTFGKDNTADFAAGSKAAGHFSAVTQVIKDLDTEKAKQGGGTATAKEVLLDALRLDLQNIARTARPTARARPRSSPPGTRSSSNSARPASPRSSSPTNCPRPSCKTSRTTSPPFARPMAR